ncbi:MAG: alpha-glucan family phosphorylase [Bryobacteraceae bacterium]|jgi:starch phosphorylase
MKPIRTFTVIPSLPAPIEGLRVVAYNLRWAWNHEAIELFRRLDRDLWESSGHNPVLMLGAIEQDKLEAAARDDAFLAHLNRVSDELESYLTGESTWFHKMCSHQADKPLVAYFSLEFGLTECLSIFAGGLGILAGDHLKSASDLGIPLVGVGLLYQQGYFRQYLNQAGWQQEEYPNNDFHNLPVSPACGRDGKLLVVEVAFPGRQVKAQVWRVQVGRVALFLLDTNFSGNARPEDRDITDQLYGGDHEMRIRQEIVLGIGGYRVLEALGLEPTVYHMNEGHSAFLALERVRRLMETRRLAFAEASQLASASLVFTTHTPVEAGHDYFSVEQMDRYFGDYARALGISRQEFLALGRRSPSDDGEFCMTVLALRLASYRNGVSKLHGQISRRMWQPLWPGVPVEEIPIGHITNGVHFRSWISLEMNQLYDRYLGPNWREEPANSDVWNRVHTIPAEELWRTHERRRERLVSWARLRVLNQRIRRSASPAEIEAADEVLDPDALTIGFARRFATYKRATLLLRDLDRLKRILSDAARPVQLIFAGKAHPRDDAGKELIRQITTFSRQKELGRSLVFLEDYDMAVARYLVQGVDVWLNTPLRPQEASGTSGMKAAANGALNLSTLDGWWDEVWRSPGRPEGIGWAIGKGETYDNREYQDQVEAEALYDLLERDVIPTFYERGADRLPRRWIGHMKASISTLCRFVNTHRMVSDYTCQFYAKAHAQFRRLEADGAARTKALAAWMARVRAGWQHVRVEAVEDGPGAALLVGTIIGARARIQLGPLTPDDVAVEMYLGRLDPAGEILEAELTPMRSTGRDAQGRYLFEATPVPCSKSGLHGFTVRVRPHHADLPAADGATPFLPGLIAWA